MTKQPTPSGERPLIDSSPDSGEPAFDPSRFGKHEFPAGLREELIKAEKPHLDPKLLQDTVPPNRKPVLAEEPVTTPRGGFAAPRAQGAIDRDAPTLVLGGATEPPEGTARVAKPLVNAAPVTGPVRAANAPTSDSPSAPPVDTSRSEPTQLIPGVRRRKDHRVLVAGVVLGLLALFALGVLLSTTPERTPATVAAPPVPAPALVSEDASVPAATLGAAQGVAPAPATAPPPSATSAGTGVEGSAPGMPHSKDKARPNRTNQLVEQPKPPAAATPKPAAAPTAAGKQPWIDGL